MSDRQVSIVTTRATPKTYQVRLTGPHLAATLKITRDELVILHRLLDERLGHILTCAFCGQKYPQNTPASGAQVLTDHILVCPKHPMRALEAKLAAIRQYAVVRKMKALEKLTF